MLSIIIPTFNEMKSGYLNKIFPGLSQLDEVEIICVDSFSTDGTYEYLKKFPVTIHQLQTNSRAARLNHGIEKSKGSMLVLHHPRTIIELNGLKHLINYEKDYYWGGFTHKFDMDHPLLRFTSWYSNFIRADLRNIFYLDHCLFVRKELMNRIGLIPEIDIFEDTELCKRLKRLCEGFRLDYYALTSAIRFENNGIIKHSIKNQILKLKYYCNVDHKKMNQLYEKKVALNARYDESRED